MFFAFRTEAIGFHLLHPSTGRTRNFILSGRNSRSAQMACVGVIVVGVMLSPVSIRAVS